jgi:hypothetical protein
MRLRDLLEMLPFERLRRLCWARGRSAAPSAAACRAWLARSYRGQVEALLDDLRRDDLRLIIRGAAEAGYDVPGGALGGTRDELGDLVRELVGGELPLAGDDEEEDDGADVIAADDEDLGAAPPPAYDPFPGVGPTWSRPLKVARVLAQLGLEVPRRLRTPRFQDLVARLNALGFEVAFESGALVDGAAASPGVAARLRLRRPAGAAPAPARRAVVVVAGAPPPPPLSPAPAEPWALALARLHLLAAVPDAARRHRPDWPSAWVAAALRGLALSEDKPRLLAIVAEQHAAGHEDPAPWVRELARHLDAAAWEVLLADLRALNAAQAAYVAALEAHIRAVVGLPPAPAAPPAPRPVPRTPAPCPITAVRPAVFAPPPRPAPAMAAAAPAPRPAPPPATSAAVVPTLARPAAGALNQRNLGVLADMFDDPDPE